MGAKIQEVKGGTMVAANTKIKQEIPETLPFLEAICWQTDDVYRFNQKEMLHRYERGWRYLNMFNNLEERELDFVKRLATQYDSWLQSNLCALN